MTKDILLDSDILSALLNRMFEISPMAMSVTTSEGQDSRFLCVNDAYLKLVGRDWSDLCGKKVAESTVMDDQARARRHDLLAHEGGYAGEYFEICRADGSMVRTLISAQRSIVGKTQYDVEAIVDISTLVESQRAYEEELASLARTDVLTGLPNRRAFDEKLSEMVRSASQLARPTLALLDLDGFKTINDAYGHSAGDEVLRIVGERLSHALRTGDFVARIGGDEFAILFQNTERPIHMLRIQQIFGALSMPMIAANTELSVGASIGVTQLRSGEAADAFYRRADDKMYENKHARHSHNRKKDV